MNRRFSSRRKNNYIIAGLCLMLVIMGIAYAAFASNLNITGSSMISSNWDIEITNIRSTSEGTTGYDITEPTYTPTTATFSTGLKVPGDEMMYEVEVSNLGTIDGQVIVTSLSCGDNEAIYCASMFVSEKFYDDAWNYNGSSEEPNMINEGIEDLTGKEITLEAKDKMYIYIVAMYNPSVTSQPDNLTTNISLTLNYEQSTVEYNGVKAPASNTIQQYVNNATNDFHSDEYKNKISSVDVLTTSVVPADAVISWDVSENQDGSVMAYLINDTANDGMYKLYIGGDGGVRANSNSNYLFADLTNVKTMNLTNLDTRSVTNMEAMFADCNSLTSIDLSGFSTTKVQQMGGMFYDCYSLTKLNLCNFNTTKVYNMNYMFYNTTNLSSVYVGSKWTDENANTTNMFTDSGTSSVTQSDTCKVDYIKDLYTPTFSEEDASGEVGTNVTIDFPDGCGSSLTCSYKKDSGEFITVTEDTTILFTSSGSLVAKVSDGTNTVSSSYMVDDPTLSTMMSHDSSKAFWNYGSDINPNNISSIDILTTKKVPSDALESWDVSKYQNGDFMAYVTNDSDNSGMYKLYIGGNGGVIAPKDSSSLFGGFDYLKSMDVSNLDTSHVKNMSSMFAHTSGPKYNLKLTEIKGLENFDTSKVTDMSRMFFGQHSLTTIDVSSFDTSNVTNMEAMFKQDYYMTSFISLTEIKGLENFDTSKVTNMSEMFYLCNSLTTLNLCSFNTSKVTNMEGMFDSTSKLTQINVGSKWTTSKATTSDMFSGSGVSSVTTGQC